MTAIPAAQPIPWPRIIGLSVSQLVAWGVLYYAFAVIVEPMGAETGWTKPQIHGAQSLGLLVSGLSAYTVGRHIDRAGGRGVMLMGALLGAVAVVLWSQVTSLWQLYVVSVLIGVASAMALYEAAFAVAARLAPGNYRRAITVITLLGGFASTAFIPLTHWLVGQLGWRDALLVLALIEVAVCAAIPLVMLGENADSRVQVKSGVRPSVFRLVRRQPVFWLLLVSYVCFAFFYTSLLFNLLPLLGAYGMSAAAAVGLYALIGPSQVTGRLGMFAIDRFIPTGAAGVFATALPVLAMLVLVSVSPMSTWFLAFPILFGAGMGIKTIVQATAAPEFLRIQEYGALQGLLAMPAQIVQAASPFFAALLWQWSGGYEALEFVLLATATVSALSFGLAAWLSRHRGF
ncbi:MFS transporter [Aestuariivirga sp.]|uniref:MFS transporter n=1 Tax=Aestuariivirga sp. TaxID=2650926 RepID=UPI0035938B7C